MCDLSDSDLRKLLNSYGEECGPITPTTRNVYVKRLEQLRYNEKSKTNIPGRNSESFSSQKLVMIPRNSLHNDRYSDPDVEITGQSFVAKKYPINVSPIPRSLENSNRRRLEHSVKPSNEFGHEDDREPYVRKWYNGSLRTLSSYLTNRPTESDLMDISDGDNSDNEGGLMDRLRRGYYRAEPMSQPTAEVRDSRTRSIFSVINSDYLPNVLLGIFITFIAIVIGSYTIMMSRYSTMELDMALEKLTCTTQYDERCFEEVQMKRLKILLNNLYYVLSVHAGNQLCDQQKDVSVPYQKARDQLNLKLRYEKTEEMKSNEWSDLMRLVISLKSENLGIVTTNGTHDLDEADRSDEVTFLRSLRPKCSIICRVKLFGIFVINWLTYIIATIFFVLIVGFTVYVINHLRLKRKGAYNRKISDMKDIINQISGLLQKQLQESELKQSVDRFISVSKIRSMLQRTYPKVSDNKYWEDLKTLMYNSEPNIEVKETFMQGEVLEWRGRFGWQGSAVQKENQITFDKGPTECLKIRNMDIDHFNKAGEEYLRREILDRLKSVGRIKHIGFLMKGSKIIVYVMCENRDVSGKAFRKINANYFNGNLLNVKFIRLNKYWERFPESKNVI